MHQKQIAKRYAEAFFELVNEKGSDTGSILLELEQLSEFYFSNSEIRQIIENPTVKIKVKLDVFEHILKNYSNDLLKDFVRTLISNDRFSCIQEVTEEFRSLLNELQNIKNVVVFSKNKLMKDHITRLKKAFKSYLKNDVNIENVQDPNIIGGIVVRIGDEVIDGSIDHQLSKMREIFNKE